MDIIECNVWCSESDLNRDLGLPDGDCWMPITIKFGAILTLKEAGTNEFIGEGRCTVYIGSASFIIDKGYNEMIQLWKIWLNS